MLLLIPQFRYATTLVASTIMNGYLLSLGWDKNVAFWGTICGFGVINYLFLTWVVTGDEDESGDDGGSKNGGGKAKRIPPGGGGTSRSAFVAGKILSTNDLDSTRASLECVEGRLIPRH